MPYLTPVPTGAQILAQAVKLASGGNMGKAMRFLNAHGLNADDMRNYLISTGGVQGLGELGRFHIGNPLRAAASLTQGAVTITKRAMVAPVPIIKRAIASAIPGHGVYHVTQAKRAPVAPVTYAPRTQQQPQTGPQWATTQPPQQEQSAVVSQSAPAGWTAAGWAAYQANPSAWPQTVQVATPQEQAQIQAEMSNCPPGQVCGLGAAIDPTAAAQAAAPSIQDQLAAVSFDWRSGYLWVGANKYSIVGSVLAGVVVKAVMWGLSKGGNAAKGMMSKPAAATNPRRRR